MVTQTSVENDSAFQFRPYQPQLVEHDYLVSKIEGKLPEELTGTLYRIGPGKFQVGQSRLHTIFEGDGMVARFVLDGKSVRYTNRYVDTEQLHDGITTNCMQRPGLTSFIGSAPWKNFRKPANTANTNIVPLGEELLALWEFGAPHRIDPDTLDTLGQNDFDGSLGYIGAFSAHPKWDPQTREMFNFGVDLFPSPRLRCYRVSPVGKATEIAAVPLRKMAWNHDFALTKKYLVFLIDPYRPSSLKGLLKSRSLADVMQYNFENSTTTVILVPRDGSPPRIIEHQAQLHLHMTNAYDDGGDVVVEFVRYENLDFLRGENALGKMSRVKTGIPVVAIRQWPESHLVQFRISKTNRITETVANPTTALEFPQYDWRKSTEQHRFTFAATTSDPRVPFYNGIAKYDHKTGDFTSYEFGKFSIGEPLFVPQHRAAEEDEGWLLAVNHDLVDNHSRLEIFDARAIESGPLATAHLHEHIPVGFHGSFVSRIAKPGPFRQETTVR
ncbi:MAG: carotenoid oxygenase family protein [Mycobacteriaceae bacterium]